METRPEMVYEFLGNGRPETDVSAGDVIAVPFKSLILEIEDNLLFWSAENRPKKFYPRSNWDWTLAAGVFHKFAFISDVVSIIFSLVFSPFPLLPYCGSVLFTKA